MRILILGGSGLLGRALRETAPLEHSIVAPARSEVDVRDAKRVQQAVADAAPDWILNASAYADVDGAEANPDTAFAINATAVGELGRIARSRSARVMHFSTDYVFDGHRADCYAEDHPTDPVNEYGATKLAGEDMLRRSGAEHVIVRTQWLFGTGGRSFLSTLWDRARAQAPVRAVEDEFGACTYVRDLASVCCRLLAIPAALQLRTLHVANRGRVSRFDVARRIFGEAGVAHLVEPCAAGAVPVAARRPSSSVLCVERVESLIGHRMPEWTDAVRRFVDAQRAGTATERVRS